MSEESLYEPKPVRQIGGGGGDFFTFENPGDRLWGRWEGTAEGKFGRLGKITELKADKPTRFSLTTALQDLEHVDVGVWILLTYEGQQRSKSGNIFKAFRIDEIEEPVPL